MCQVEVSIGFHLHWSKTDCKLFVEIACWSRVASECHREGLCTYFVYFPGFIGPSKWA
jgi:hypothetical protein